MKTNRKLITLILVIIIPFFIFLYFYTRDYEYDKDYKIKKFSIKESYDKEEKLYKFNLKYKENTYYYVINHDYLNKRQLINEVVMKEKANQVCILPNSEYLEFYPLCYVDNKLVSFNNSNLKLKYNYKYSKKVNKNYKDVEIYNWYNKKYLVNNYYGFYYLNNEKNKNIKLFSKDTYDMNLTYQLNDYLLVADYSVNNLFAKFYIINIKNGKYEKLEINSKLPFTSRFLGDYKDKIYLVDPKEEKEYAIDAKRNKISETDGLIYNGEEFVTEQVTRIIKKNLSFTKNNRYNYELINDNLYQVVDDNKILLSNQTIKDIIYTNDEDVYYLVDDTLYVYNHYYGELKLMKYFEWHFNYKNKIYIF